MKYREKISALKEWWVNIQYEARNFIYAQIAAYFVLFVFLYNHASVDFVLLAAIFTLIIPFALVIKVLTDNPLYLTLKDKSWGKAVIAVVVGIYSALSAIWASSEINGIFSVSALNLPWATSILSIVYFFKSIVVALIGSFIVLIVIYTNFWVVDLLILNYKGFSNLVRRVVSGIALVFGLGLFVGTSGAITKHGDFFAKYVAVKADFNTGHRCKGSQFENIDGVLFLSSGSVLIAKPMHGKTGEFGWSFEASRCEF